MSTRCIIAGVCALALALPAVAGARPAVGPFVEAHGTPGIAYGSTAYLLQNQRDLSVPAVHARHDTGVTYGSTAYALQNLQNLGGASHAGRVHVVKVTDGQLQAAFLASHLDSKAVLPHLTDSQIAAAFLAEKAGTTTASAHATDDSSTDWRTAAIVEAALLAALALGATTIVLSRRRTPSLGV